MQPRCLPCLKRQAFVAAHHGESLQDWERKTISHCNLVPLHEILLKHSQNSSDLAFPAT